MPVSSRHVLSQGPMIAALGKTAARALSQKLNGGKGKSTAPSPEITRTLAAPGNELLDAYIAHVGGDVKAYKNSVPPHLFPHWVMPVAADTLANLPYPLTRTLNGGCRMQVNKPIPRGEALEVRAQLVSVDDDGRRAVLKQRVITSTKSAPDALEVELYAIVPLSNVRKTEKSEKSDKNGKAPEKARVPLDAKEIGFTHLGSDAGLSYAKLTGDFNPIHWIPAAAKAAGFKNVILHGFASLARTCEALNRGVFGGDVTRLAVLDVKLTRPLVLPHDVGFFVTGHPADEVFLGDALGGPAYLTGKLETRA